MAREVVWTEPAWEDLEAAAEYIARDSEAYAAVFVEDMKAAAASLSDMAGRGQIVPEIGDASIRELLVRPYRLVYQLSEEQVRILAVIHGARRAWRT
ncbi:MAG: type II toxin-antitoxin system RelE/ParE family toxin [Candidatus Rokubacteria bacterium]|nr:type II toxin-antitoxin system RelE/ParE family toxin [Candidatus Rokubacteria bacterium]